MFGEAVPFTTSWVGVLTLTGVVGLGAAGWRLLVAQNRKLDRIVSYLFTPKTTKEGIPGAPANWPNRTKRSRSTRPSSESWTLGKWRSSAGSA